MAKVTYAELKSTFPDEKKKVESLYGRIIPVRQMSYLVTLPLLRLNVTAFQASIISMFIALIACLLIALPFSVTRVIGVILVPIWHIFDCVDGNIARYTKTASDFGSAVDAICGYFITSFLPLSLGIASYNIQNNYLNLPPVLYVIAGGLASISFTLMKLIHQKYAFSAKLVEEKTGQYIEKGEHQYTLTGFHKLRKIFEVEFGIVGLPMFVLWLCPVLNLYHLLTVYYCLFFCASLVLITVFYLKKCK